MDHLEGTGETGDGRLGFNRRVRLEFRGTHLSSDGGLLVMRELDDALDPPCRTPLWTSPKAAAIIAWR
jgi:hypothetical protein